MRGVPPNVGLYTPYYRNGSKGIALDIVSMCYVDDSKHVFSFCKDEVGLFAFGLSVL